MAALVVLKPSCLLGPPPTRTHRSVTPSREGAKREGAAAQRRRASRAAAVHHGPSICLAERDGGLAAGRRNDLGRGAPRDEVPAAAHATTQQHPGRPGVASLRSPSPRNQQCALWLPACPRPPATRPTRAQDSHVLLPARPHVVVVGPRLAAAKRCAHRTSTAAPAATRSGQTPPPQARDVGSAPGTPSRSQHGQEKRARTLHAGRRGVPRAARAARRVVARRLLLLLRWVVAALRVLLVRSAALRSVRLLLLVRRGRGRAGGALPRRAATAVARQLVVAKRDLRRGGGRAAHARNGGGGGGGAPRGGGGSSGAVCV